MSGGRDSQPRLLASADEDLAALTRQRQALIEQLAAPEPLCRTALQPAVGSDPPPGLSWPQRLDAASPNMAVEVGRSRVPWSGIGFTGVSGFDGSAGRVGASDRNLRS